MAHEVPDPPTQDGCTGCGADLRHGLSVGDRVLVVAPHTARMAATVIGLSLDTADLMVDGRDYPLGHVHCKWLVPADEPAETVCRFSDEDDGAWCGHPLAEHRVQHATAVAESFPSDVLGRCHEPGADHAWYHRHGSRWVRPAEDRGFA
jgi:hypothetical protein